MTERRLKIFRPSGTWAIPRVTISWAGTPTSDWPSRRISPWRGARRPEIVLRVVVFPAPLFPSRATISRAPTEIVIPRSARISPYETWRSLTSSIRLPPAAAPQIGLDHPGVLLDLGGLPPRGLLPPVAGEHAG